MKKSTKDSSSENQDLYNYLDNLNSQQRAAVEYLEGPELVIAGAGSGKTRVLTHKIVHLIRCGIPPERILALTFTNKAAREMKERIDNMIGKRQSYRLWSGTFHSVFLKILRRHADLIGFKSNFTIYDTSDSKALLKSIIKSLTLDEKTYKTGAILSDISNAKNALITPQQYLNNKDLTDADKRAKRPLTGRIYQLYAERCKTANSMDFDDILLFMNVLLRDNDEVCDMYADWFRYILVDEYQDTNFAQHLIITQLACKHNALCVVGDDAQSIYSFRGANIGNILNLEKRFPDLKTFKLEQNYRSSKNIVKAADSLIAKNKRQIKKNVFTENPEGDKIKVIKTYSDLEEAATVASQIIQLKNRFHDSAEDFVVLYRTNAQSRPLEEALRKKNLAYRIYGGLSFYQRKEIKDVIAYFRTTVNPDDDEALLRIINYPARGIGSTTIGKLRAAAVANNLSIWGVLNSPDFAGCDFNSGTQKKLNAFKEMITEFITENKTSDAFALAQIIYNRTGVLSVLANEKTPEEISKRENLIELLAGLKEFVESKKEEGNDDLSMTAFLNEVSLATDQDEKDTDSQNKITLMTAHAAKGLEFKHVFIVGVEEELFPSAQSMNFLNEIEEERRLLYVAITRAQNTCTITFAGSRFRNGQTVITRPSRFLKEIDSAYTESGNSLDFPSSQNVSRYINPIHNYKIKESNRSNGPDQPQEYSIRSEVVESSDKKVRKGTVIKHNIFGRGVISRIENLNGDEIIIIDFEEVGKKKLLLKYAKFEIIEK